MVKISKTEEFDEWLASLRTKEQGQIEARLNRIQAYDHFGDCSPIEGTGYAMAELKWKNGWRVYFYREDINAIKLLIGGKKNDQKRDIKKATVLLGKYAHLKK